jgi:hypothetical protein
MLRRAQSNLYLLQRKVVFRGLQLPDTGDFTWALIPLINATN